MQPFESEFASRVGTFNDVLGVSFGWLLKNDSG